MYGVFTAHAIVASLHAVNINMQHFVCLPSWYCKFAIVLTLLVCCGIVFAGRGPLPPTCPDHLFWVLFWELFSLSTFLSTFLRTFSPLFSTRNLTGDKSEMKIWCFLFLGALCDRKAGFPSHDSRSDHCALSDQHSNAFKYSIQVYNVHCPLQPTTLHCTPHCIKCICIPYTYCMYIFKRQFRKQTNANNSIVHTLALSLLCIALQLNAAV